MSIIMATQFNKSHMKKSGRILLEFPLSEKSKLFTQVEILYICDSYDPFLSHFSLSSQLRGAKLKRPKSYNIILS